MTPEKILRALSELIENRADQPDSDLLLQIVDTVLRMKRDGAPRGDLKMVNHALKELRRAFRVFAPYRGVRKVSVFGSARTASDDPSYRQACEFANRMTQLGYMVITGAGSGIMEAAQGGAGRDRSFGVKIRLPFEPKANDFIEDDHKLVNFKYFFTRKVIFVKETDAIALFPGGFGTHDEGFESLTLVQTGKSDLLPLVFVDPPGGTYWKDWKDYLCRQLRDQGFIDANDISLFKITESVEEAAATIERFYSNYHSMRYVDSQLLLRLEKPISDALLRDLNRDFSDLLVKGSIERLPGPLPQESDEPQLTHLHRLTFHFDRQSFGRLRQMIDVVNSQVTAESPTGGGAQG